MEATEQIESQEAVNEFMTELDSTETEDPKPEDQTEDPKPEDQEAGEEKVNTDEEEAIETVEPGKVPVGVVKELRQTVRDLRTQNAETEGRLTQLSQMIVQQRGTSQEQNTEIGKPEVELSPLQKFAEEYPDMAPDAETLIAERSWHEAKVTERAEVAEQTRLDTEIETSKSNARQQFSAQAIGEGLDIDSVVALARQSGVLTQADYNYASSKGINSAQTLYRLAIQNIRDARGEPLKVLNSRIANRKPASRQKTNVNSSPPGGEPETGEEIEGDFSNITNFLFPK